MNRSSSARRHGAVGQHGFVLLEAMLAVVIFALAVLSLGRCVTNCLAAERFKVEDALARRALENRVAEIEAGAVQPAGDSQETLPAPFVGLTLKQSCSPLHKKNENGVELSGLISVQLEVSWRSSSGTESRNLVFYVRSRNS